MKFMIGDLVFITEEAANANMPVNCDTSNRHSPAYKNIVGEIVKTEDFFAGLQSCNVWWPQFDTFSKWSSTYLAKINK
jgi:hypothetical protein